jgi:hypothetical protein
VPVLGLQCAGGKSGLADLVPISEIANDTTFGVEPPTQALTVIPISNVVANVTK